MYTDSTSATLPLSSIGKRLVAAEVLSQEKMLNIQADATQKGRTLTSHMVRDRLVDPVRFAHVAAEDFGMPLVDLGAVDLKNAPTDLVNEELMRKHLIIPIQRRGKRLFVAVADPGNKAGMDEISFSSGYSLDAILAPYNSIEPALDRALAGSSQAFGELTEEDTDLEKLDYEKGEEQDEKGLEAGSDDAPVVRFVNKVLVDAIRKGASDIHFEPYEEQYRVRFRIDGMLITQVRPPKRMAPRLSARLKVMSNLDIAERRVPQDGRIKLKLSRTRAIDFRVSSLPTLYGEKIVMRILDPSSAAMGIDQLGYEEHQKEAYLKALSRPYGMILVTGPTGSGKTVSLYTGLGILNTADRNISTAEDPSEINMPGVNQVNINPKVGLTFASALRAFLRQDPDVIMVGEIRDLETAEISIKAAQTGHLVLSTLHTNDAPQTLTRLANMGVPPYNIASSILLIIAQRLARRLCPNCKEPEKLPEEALRKEGFTDADIQTGVVSYRAVGCDQCTNGYKGRLGIYQVMPISDDMQRGILEGYNSMQLAEQAEKEGIEDLRRAGLVKVMAGLTSLEEVNRVTKD